MHEVAAIGWPRRSTVVPSAISCPQKEVPALIRALVIIVILAVLVLVARRVYRAVLALRVGAIPDDVDVPEVTMEPDRGWQVTRLVKSGVATINVEHPVEGIARTWTIHLREPGAARTLEQAMHRAGLLARDLANT